MKLLRQSLSRVFSILLLALLASCAGESVRTEEAVLSSFPDATIEAKIDRLKRAAVVEASGVIEVRGISMERRGNFSLVIRGEDLSLEVYAGGIRVAEVELAGGVARTSPNLGNEYLEHMFAAILRDSITWWNVMRYETVEYERYLLLRNSWRKLYVDRLQYVPERQIFRLTGMRTVEVTYSGQKRFSAGLLPSRVRFVFDGYECVLDIKTVTLSGDITERAGRGPSPQF